MAVLLYLSSMYELSSSRPTAEAKSGLAAWAVGVAPTDLHVLLLQAN